MPALHIKVTGLVQGVFFRANTLDKANELGLKGWVKNCDDGSVEIHVEGSDEALSKFEEWCNHGPEAAKVEGVEVKEVEEEGFESFSIV